VRARFAVVAFWAAQGNIHFCAMATLTGFFGAVFVFDVTTSAASHAKDLSLTSPANSAGFSACAVTFWTFCHSLSPLNFMVAYYIYDIYRQEILFYN
jgi:hypothetical protein